VSVVHVAGLTQADCDAIGITLRGHCKKLISLYNIGAFVQGTRSANERSRVRFGTHGTASFAQNEPHKQNRQPELSEGLKSQKRHTSGTRQVLPVAARPMRADDSGYESSSSSSNGSSSRSSAHSGSPALRPTHQYEADTGSTGSHCGYTDSEDEDELPDYTPPRRETSAGTPPRRETSAGISKSRRRSSHR
jgi:hypothetical protein